MKLRREGDQPLRLVVSHSPGAGSSSDIGGLTTGQYDVDRRTHTLGPADSGPETSDVSSDGLYLIAVDEQEAALVVGLEVDRFTRGIPDSELRGKILSQATIRHAATTQHARKVRALREFVLLVEALQRAGFAHDVFDALEERAPRIVDGFTVFVLVQGIGADGALAWQGRSSRDHLAPYPEAVSLSDTPPLSSAPGLLTASDVDPHPLLAATGARALAYAPIGDRALLCVVERRADRSFEAEDWYRLKLIARQAEVALQRIDTA